MTSTPHRHHAPCEGGDQTVRPAPRAIRNHLERLLHSHEIEGTPRLSELLGFLVEECLAGRAARLDERRIAVELFGREAAFDAATDPLVRNHADRLRTVLDRYHVTEGLGSAVRILLPPDSLIPQFLTVRLASGPAPALGACSVARMPRRLRPGGPAVAVLPFRHEPAEPEMLPIAHGFAAEIGLVLTRFEAMQVIAAHSTHQHGGNQESDLRRIGADLDARFLVLGSLRRHGDECHGEARLYDTHDARLVWAERHAVRLDATRLCELQHRIADQVAIRVAMAGGHVARALSRECLGQPADRPDTALAVMRQRYYTCTMTPEHHAGALQVLQRASRHSPRHATTLAMLSGLHVDTVGHGLGESCDQTLTTALRLAGRAVALEPECQQARWNLAYVYLHRQEAVAALAEADRAAGLNPGDAGLAGEIGWTMAMLGNWERGLALLARSHWLNPHHPAHWYIAWYLDRFRQGDFEGALQYARLLRSPQRFWGPLMQAAALSEMDRLEEAREQIARVMAVRPDFEGAGRRLVRAWIYTGDLDRCLFDALGRLGLRLAL